MCFVGSSSVLPSFAALNTAEGSVLEGDGMNIPMRDDFIDQLIEQSDIALSAENGVLANPMMGNDDGTRIGSDGIMEYTVQGGDTLGEIADQFGISATTIVQVNSLSSKKKLRQGQVLKILPVDGYLYLTDQEDSLDATAKKLNVDSKLLAEHNSLDPSKTIPKGKKLVVPGTQVIQDTPEVKMIAADVVPVKNTDPKKKDEKNTAKDKDKNGKKDEKKKVEIVSAKKKPTTSLVVDKGRAMLYPVGAGVMTQKFHYGHPGIDLAYVKGDHTTGIVAARGGRVVIAQGGWNGGYGNYVVVDHGDGMKTLYAHLRDIYVSVGDTVSAGQMVGWMGNTGHVYGRTGLHLHFEVRLGKEKVNPLNYL